MLGKKNGTSALKFGSNSDWEVAIFRTSAFFQTLYAITYDTKQSLKGQGSQLKEISNCMQAMKQEMKDMKQERNETLQTLNAINDKLTTVDSKLEKSVEDIQQRVDAVEQRITQQQ